MRVIWLQSDLDGPPPTVAAHAATWIISQAELSVTHLEQAGGLVTGRPLDQNALLALRPAIEAFLDRGGRWFFNGHVVRPLIDGLAPFEPMAMPKRPDFDQTRLAPHPIFDGIEIGKLETNKGVAGFYGRGANPMPPGAIAVTGLRGGTVPVDWVWCRPRGGRVFSHAGNDLGQMGLEWGLAALLQTRILDWAAGGACLCD
ncbi:hypothetical protein [Aquicoccus sp. SU-CL01552]|uniref:hypothetical protein n=1 Tax=Aquicoccus sp. SU-CL01552 TaxID=3127656 RepID=UPI00310486E7